MAVVAGRGGGEGEERAAAALRRDGSEASDGGVDEVGGIGEGGAAASSSSSLADEEEDEADEGVDAGPGDDERTGGGMDRGGEVSRDDSEERSLDGASSPRPPSSSWSLGGEPRGIVVGSGAVTKAAAAMVRGSKEWKEVVRSQEARAKEAVIFERLSSQAHWMVARNARTGGTSLARRRTAGQAERRLPPRLRTRLISLQAAD